MSFAPDPLKSDPMPGPPQNEYEQPPPPTGSSRTADEQQWGMFCHLAGALPVPPVIGPSLGSGICWLLKKEVSPWVDEQGKKALNFHLTNLLAMGVVLLICLPLLCVPFLNVIALALGSFLVGGVKIYGLITAIIAALTVKDNKPFEYPFSFKFIK